jgi:ribosomal-protein-alanine N-acetyltransferase
MTEKIFLRGPDTARLSLMAFEPPDAAAFYALNSSVKVMQYTGEPLMESVEAAEEAIRTYRDFDEVGYGRWACHFKRESRIIGFCGLKYLHERDEVDLGYRFLPEYWGQGLATEACLATLEFGFGTIGLSRIIALVLPENTASIRVAEKCGMQFEDEVAYEGQRVLLYAVEKPC